MRGVSLSFRFWLTAILLGLSSAAVFTSLRLGTQSDAGAFLLNIGAEAGGLVLTVALIEWLIEKQNVKAEVRRISSEALHAIDHAAWVWLGGKREFDIGETEDLLQRVSDDDQMAHFTQNLVLSLGERSDYTLRIQQQDARSDRRLLGALNDLRGLLSLRDNLDLPPSREVAACLLKAIHQLSQIEPQRTGESGARAEKRLDSSKDLQEWRHYGYRPKTAEPDDSAS